MNNLNSCWLEKRVWLVLAQLSVMLGAALAGSAAADQQSAAEVSPALEEIVVTATKQPERVLDVPVSISVVNTDTIRAMGATNLNDLAMSIPNVSSNFAQMGTTITIRGIASAANNPGFSTGTGVYVDDVYMGNGLANNFPLVDIDRVEVLRGPQGTLFGKNTIQGALNIVTKDPGDEVDGSMDVRSGSYHDFRALGSVGGPIDGDTVYGKIAVIDYSNRGSYYNPFTNTYQEETYGNGGRGVLVWKAAKDLDVRFSGDWLDGRPPGQARALVNLPGLSETDIYDRTVPQSIPNQSSELLWGGSAKVSYTGSAVSFVSITAYRVTDTSYYEDEGFTTQQLLYAGRSDDYRQFTQEFRLSGSTAALKWLVGLYYFNSSLDDTTRVTLGNDFFTLFGGPVQSAPAETVLPADLDTRSYAAFTSVDYSLSTKLTLGLGLRYTDEKLSVQAQQNLEQPAFIGVFGDIPSSSGSREKGDLSPTVTLTYAPSHDSSLYARYARGFRSGGFNLVPNFNPHTWEFGDETAKDYEVGWKSDVLDGHLGFDLSVFHVNYENLQQQTQVGLAFIVGNAAQAYSNGGEFEVRATPSDWLTISGGAGFDNARYKSYPNPAPGVANYNGNQLIGAPRWNGSVAAELTRKTRAGILFLRPEVQYQGSSFLSSANVEPAVQGAVTLLNLRTGLRGEGGRWEAAVYGNNLLDQITTPTVIYPSAIGSIIGANKSYEVALSQPITFGAELLYKF